MRRYRELRRSRHSRCIYFTGESWNRDAWLGRIMRWSKLKPASMLIFSQDRTIRLLLDTMFGWILPMKRRSWHPECCCAHVYPLWARRQAFGRLVAYFQPRHFRCAAIDFLCSFVDPQDVNGRVFSYAKSDASKSIKLWHKHFVKMRMKVAVRRLCNAFVTCIANTFVRCHL